MAQFISTDGPQLPRRGLPPHEMPHGLLAVPDWVREALAREVAKRPEVWGAEAEERTLCDWTLQHYFESEGYEVLYRRTPAGPEVVAVGWQEELAARQGLPQDEQNNLITWLP